jgi:uncharacterized protein (TIGR02246 family)
MSHEWWRVPVALRPRNRCLASLLLVCVCAGGASSAVGQEPSTASEPERIVQRQVEAYNARDLEAFLAHYAEDVEVFGFPAEPWMSGIDQFRERYGELFRNSPELHAEITTRIVRGPYVIDEERVTGMQDRPEVRAVAIYEVRDGLIRRVWFIF